MKTKERLITFLTGAIATLILVLLISASGQATQEQDVAEKDTYEVKVNDGTVVILNTKTGEFVVGHQGWSIQRYNSYSFKNLSKQN